MSFRCSSIHTVHLLNLSSLPSSMRSFSHFSSASQGTSFYERGLAYRGGPAPPSCLPCLRPGVSFHLIRLTQFTQYLVAVRVSGLPPVELSACFSGASGHSQGLVTAVAIFSSKDDVSFLENVQKAHKWLFSLACGVSSSFLSLPSSHLSLRIPLMGERVNPRQCCPSTAYSSKTFSKTNKYLPDNSQISVSLHNSPRHFIDTGPPRALYGLVANLRKIRTSNGIDQSKVEFSKRKPVFNMRSLVVGVPFHSQYLRDAADKVIHQDLNGEELWTAEGLQIPVYHTENGGWSNLLS